MKLLTLLLFLSLVGFADAQTNAYQRRGLSVDSPSNGPMPVVSNLQLRDHPIDSELFELAYRHFLESRPEFGKSTFTILQTLEEGKFLVASKGGGDFVLIYPSHKAADGTIISVPTQATGHTYDFITVLGARRRLALHEVKTDRLTRAEFIQLIQNGVKFSITKIGAAIACRECGGVGKLPIKTGKRTGDGKAKCGSCMGTGKAEQIYEKKVSW